MGGDLGLFLSLRQVSLCSYGWPVICFVALWLQTLNNSPASVYRVLRLITDRISPPQFTKWQGMTLISLYLSSKIKGVCGQTQSSDFFKKFYFVLVSLSSPG